MITPVWVLCKEGHSVINAGVGMECISACGSLSLGYWGHGACSVWYTWMLSLNTNNTGDILAEMVTIH